MEQEPSAPESVGPCPSDDELARFTEGRLGGEDLTTIERHLAGCESCMALVAAVLDEDEELGLAATRTAHDSEPLAEHAAPVRRLGRYLVLSRLGAGGMGVVYEGYDPQIDRKVALKLVRVAAQGDDERRGRLLREARAMGQLSHPNIVGVFDVGTAEAGVFIAMELIDGHTLQEWVELGKRPWREVVACFVQAGEGLAAAHDQGLVHRDFKPSNVMVGEDGRVRVLDFGLARIEPQPVRGVELTAGDEDEPTVTRAGAIMGTPAYMSPEQLAGRVADARSDQFSFCVALHEALFGERPFAGRSFESLAARVLEGRTRAPSRRGSVPPRVLRVIRRGLAVQPDERWPDMHALLRALDPAPRRRRALAAGSLLGVAAATALYGALAGGEAEAPCRGASSRFAETWGDAERSALRRSFAATEDPGGDELATAVETILDDYAERWVEGHTDACEATHLHASQSDALLDLRMSCLERSRREVDAALELLTRADAELMPRAVTLVSGLPTPHRCADVIALQADLPPPEDPVVAREVERVHDALIEVGALGRAGRFEQALPRVRSLIEEADAIGHPPLSAEVRLDAGELHKFANRLEEAETLVLDAYWRARPLGDDVTIIEAEIMLVSLLGQRRQQFEAAHQWARHARADLERTGGSPDHLHRYHRNFGAVLSAEQHHREALAEFEPALELSRELYGEHPLTAQALYNVAGAHLRLGERDQALKELVAAQTMYLRVLGPNNPALIEPTNAIGLVHLERDEPERAIELFERAIELSEAAFGPDSPRTAEPRMNLGVAFYDQGRLDEARGVFQDILRIATATYGDRHNMVATAHYNLADVDAKQGRHADALPHYRLALEIFESSLGADHPGLAELLTRIAESQLRAGERAAAERTVARAEVLCRHEGRPEEACDDLQLVRAQLDDPAAALPSPTAP